MDNVKFLAGMKLLRDAFSSKQKFKDAKLNDGTTIVRYDAEKLDIGVPVLAVTEQGAIAIPDGDYVLEDGTAFTIAGGVVSNVKPAEGEPDAGGNPGMMPAPAAEMTEAKAKSIIESVIRESRFVTETALETALAEYKIQKENFNSQKAESEKTISELKAEVEKQRDTITQMFALLEKIADEPSVTPADSNRPAGKKKSQKELQAEFRNTLK